MPDDFGDNFKVILTQSNLQTLFLNVITDSKKSYFIKLIDSKRGHI